MQKKIYYHDTDAGGVVYYANYLKYFEEARTEFLAEKGIFIKKLVGQGVLFVVARQEVDYKAPSFYGDVLKINTRVINISNVKIEFGHEIKNQKGKLVCLSKVILVCTDTKLKPQAIPNNIRERLSA